MSHKFVYSFHVRVVHKNSHVSYRDDTTYSQNMIFKGGGAVFTDHHLASSIRAVSRIFAVWVSFVEKFLDYVSFRCGTGNTAFVFVRMCFYLQIHVYVTIK